MGVQYSTRPDTVPVYRPRRPQYQYTDLARPQYPCPRAAWPNTRVLEQPGLNTRVLGPWPGLTVSGLTLARPDSLQAHGARGRPLSHLCPHVEISILSVSQNLSVFAEFNYFAFLSISGLFAN